MVASRAMVPWQAYPAWQARVKAEVEPIIKLLSDQTIFDQDKIQQSPFANFDKNAYFK